MDIQLGEVLRASSWLEKLLCTRCLGQICQKRDLIYKQIRTTNMPTTGGGYGANRQQECTCAIAKANCSSAGAARTGHRDINEPTCL
jgi:hypothetical protein